MLFDGIGTSGQAFAVETLSLYMPHHYCSAWAVLLRGREKVSRYRVKML